MLNAFQIKPGWAVYALLLLLGLAAVLGFSRVLSRLRFVPVGSYRVVFGTPIEQIVRRERAGACFSTYSSGDA